MPKSRKGAKARILSSDELGAVAPLRPTIQAISKKEPIEETSSAPVPPAVANPNMHAVRHAGSPPRRHVAFKEARIQQTLYLPPAVHDQLRALAFVERVKMHALIMEGLDAVFKSRGLRLLSSPTPKE